MANDYLTIKEVASLYKVSISTVRRLLRSGKLLGHYVGSQWRFDPEEIKAAVKDGRLSVLERTSVLATTTILPLSPPEWAEPIITKWRVFVNQVIEQFSPDHVVLLDRRGAKIWSYLLPHGYVWGENLWHSTALDYMTPQELKDICSRRRILLFDEMIQHGREMSKMRQRLADQGADVQSIVLVRRMSHAIDGLLAEYNSRYCEDLSDHDFSIRTSQISELLKKAQPPLDVDHLVAKGTLESGLTPEEMLIRLADWGMPYVVWEPEHGHDLSAITLDRPQFYRTRKTFLQLNLIWDGPCKLRLYNDFQKGFSYCSFIAFPSINGARADWIETERLMTSKSNSGEKKMRNPELGFQDDESCVEHVYSRIYSDLAVGMLEDFVYSDAARQIGIAFNSGGHSLDKGQILATYGNALGNEIYKRASQIVAHDGAKAHLFWEKPDSLLSLFIRPEQTDSLDFDSFSCRTEVLQAIPRKFPSHNTEEPQQDPLQYEELYKGLPRYAETTIGRVLDNELDRGTVKPISKLVAAAVAGDNSTMFSVERSFQRGEFGAWFEQDKTVITIEDRAIKRTQGLCPFVLDFFQKLLNKPQITGAHFAKLFTNLQHDWQKALGDLYLGWKPYKYGPLPTVPHVDSMGNFQLLENFLIDQKCLTVTRERHKTRILKKYAVSAPGALAFDWRSLFENTMTPLEIVFVKGIVKLYAEIQKKCFRHRASPSGDLGILKDPLVVLAAARNSRVNYICCWFELEDWVRKGSLLLPILQAIALSPSKDSSVKFKQELWEFAEPARLLDAKLEMYRALPELRQQIEGMEFAEVILGTLDETPVFDSAGTYPLKTMEWASRAMRAFSSYMRQILTACNIDEMPEVKAVKSPDVYMAELLVVCPELGSLKESMLSNIVDSQKGVLTVSIAECLSKCFHILKSLLQARLPDPLPDKNKIVNDVLQQKLLQLQIQGPHAVVVADIRNFQGLIGLCDIFGSDYDQAIAGMLEWVNKTSHEVIRKFKNITPPIIANDNVIFAGSDVNEVLRTLLELTKSLFRELGEYDKGIFARFGLLRAGVAWRDNSAGAPLTGVKPGLLAYGLGDQTRIKIGDICITQRILERVNLEMQKEFEPFDLPNDRVIERAKKEQGGAFIRRFDENRDLS